MRVEATGVYEIDEQEPFILVQEDVPSGERFAEVQIRLISNRMEGLPETMNLRFSDYDLARMVANKSTPFQVTVEYDSPEIRFGPQEPPDNSQIFNRPINGEVRPISEFFEMEKQ